MKKHKKTAGGKPAVENRLIVSGTDRICRQHTRYLTLSQAATLYCKLTGRQNPDPVDLPAHTHEGVWIFSRDMSFETFIERNRIKTIEEVVK